MKYEKWFFLVIALIGIGTLAGCSMFAKDQPEDTQEMVQTHLAWTQAAQDQIEEIVAETLTALPPEKPELPEVDAPIVDSPAVETSDAPAVSATPSLAPTELPPTITTENFTLTAAAPFAEVNVPTNCRTGPGKNFDQVSVLNVGTQVEVIAKTAAGTYWVVKNPGGEGTCWLWDQYAIITGSTADLPVWDSPPTPTPKAGITSSPTQVTLKVSVPTNCRVGPGIPYEIVTVLQTNKTVNVVARHASADFWVIENPAGSGTCWVWGEHAIFTGVKESLPVQESPPAPTPVVEVTLKVNVPTNCRVGPGIPYEIVTVLQTNKTVNVIARHTSADFWVIENPVGTGTCWVWGEHATFTGAKENLPIQEPPPAPTPQAQLTPTSVPVTLTVRVDTNCRVGPGMPYEIVTIFRIGQNAEVVGRNALSTYWVIRNPAGPGTCWVWGKYATLTGFADRLPIWDVPPKP